MSFHLDTLSWFCSNQCLLWLVNAACFSELFRLTDWWSKQRFTAFAVSTLNITLRMQYNCILKFIINTIIVYLITHCNLKHDSEYWDPHYNWFGLGFNATFNSVSLQLFHGAQTGKFWPEPLWRNLKFLYYLIHDFDFLIMILKLVSDLRKKNGTPWLSIIY